MQLSSLAALLFPLLPSAALTTGQATHGSSHNKRHNHHHHTTAKTAAATTSTCIGQGEFDCEPSWYSSSFVAVEDSIDSMDYAAYQARFKTKRHEHHQTSAAPPTAPMSNCVGMSDCDCLPPLASGSCVASQNAIGDQVASYVENHNIPYSNEAGVL